MLKLLSNILFKPTFLIRTLAQEAWTSPGISSGQVLAEMRRNVYPKRDSLGHGFSDLIRLLFFRVPVITISYLALVPRRLKTFFLAISQVLICMDAQDVLFTSLAEAEGQQEQGAYFARLLRRIFQWSESGDSELVKKTLLIKLLWGFSWVIRIPLALVSAAIAASFYAIWHLISWLNIIVSSVSALVGIGFLTLNNLPSYFAQWLRSDNYIPGIGNFFISLIVSTTAAGVVFLLLGFSLLPIVIAAGVGFLYSLLIHRPGAYFNTSPMMIRIGIPVLMLIATFGSIGLLPFAGVAVPLLPLFFAGFPAVAIGFIGAGFGIATVLVCGVGLAAMGGRFGRFGESQQDAGLLDFYRKGLPGRKDSVAVDVESLQALCRVKKEFGYDNYQQMSLWVNIGADPQQPNQEARYQKYTDLLIKNLSRRPQPKVGRPAYGFVISNTHAQSLLAKRGGVNGLLLGQGYQGMRRRSGLPVVAPDPRTLQREQQDQEYEQELLKSLLERSQQEAEAEKDKRPTAWRDANPTPEQLGYLINPLTQLCQMLKQYCPRSVFSGSDADQRFINLAEELSKFAVLPETSKTPQINALLARFNTWYLETPAPAPESSVELETVKRLASQVLECAQLELPSEEQIDDLNAQAIAVRDQRLNQTPWTGVAIQYIETRDQLDSLLAGENAEWVKRHTWYIDGYTKGAGNLPLYRHMLATLAEDSIPARNLPQQRYMIGAKAQGEKTVALISQLRAAKILPQLESAPDSDDTIQSAASASLTQHPLSPPASLPPIGKPETPLNPPNPPTPR